MMMDYDIFARSLYHQYLEELESCGIGLITYEEFLKINSDVLSRKWNTYLQYLNECE